MGEPASTGPGNFVRQKCVEAGRLQIKAGALGITSGNVCEADCTGTTLERRPVDARGFLN